ncbi:MAG: NAD(P)/FAD-dependent oxidoreductase [Pseudomonadota bacterium]|nr:NAD(P)/FAD-dependent oxidoreductase [Pseudomonadota bacterium]
MSNEHVDVLVVGAGISGVSAAHHLQTQCPDKSFLILEGRDTIGGTWDLFKYPGIRSDSDMYTLGFSFRPWRDPKAIADGPSIMSYLRGAVEDGGLQDKIRFGRKVVKAQWSSQEARWELTVLNTQNKQEETLTCGFVHMCTGYYNYEQGHRPAFPGEKNFKGPVIHPQFWPEDLNYDNKKVVIIGSGATAVTLVPAMAEKAAKVIMLQRSPTYIVSMPAENALANWARRNLPAKLAYGLTRWRNVLFSRLMFWYCRRFPERAKKLLLKGVRAELPSGFDIEKHLTPHYNVWDQRVCLAPDGDFFTALRAGKADIVTDHIESFTKRGVKVASGAEIEADIIVSATGLDLQFFGGVDIQVDNKAVLAKDTMTYKGMMFSGVPNFALSSGYTNASWTLKCDLTSAYVCRLLNHMERKGYTQARPELDWANIEVAPLLDFTSGYVVRKLEELPKQGTVTPWRLHQNYLLDIMMLRMGRVTDGMAFSGTQKSA